MPFAHVFIVMFVFSLNLIFPGMKKQFPETLLWNQRFKGGTETRPLQNTSPVLAGDEREQLENEQAPFWLMLCAAIAS